MADPEPLLGPLLPSPGGELIGDAPSRSLGVLQIVGITFFAVAGGAFGIELAVASAGPAIALLALLVMPWIWSLPQALMTAELCCLMPEDGGYILWCHQGLGSFAGFINAFWMLCSSATENALYPLMFVEYLSYIFPALQGGTDHNLSGNSSHAAGLFVGGENWLTRWCLSWVCVVVATVNNLLGVDMVGRCAIVFAIIVMSPFLVLIIAGAPFVAQSGGGGSQHPWLTGPRTTEVDWGVFVSLLLWNLSGFASGGTIAGSVRDVKRTYPLAMVITLVIVQLTYLLPVAVGVCVEPEWRNWTEGYFVVVARKSLSSSGPAAMDAISIVFAVSGAMSGLGLLNTLLGTSAHACWRMSELGMLPRMFSLRTSDVFKVSNSERRSPFVALIVLGFIAGVLSALHFSRIVEISSTFLAWSTMMQWCALVRLRWTHAGVTRPYSVPADRRVLAALGLLPLGMCILQVTSITTYSLVIACGASVLAASVYVLISIWV